MIDLRLATLATVALCLSSAVIAQDAQPPGPAQDAPLPGGQPNILSVSDNVTLREGDMLSLKCKVENAGSDANVVWFHNLIPGVYQRLISLGDIRVTVDSRISVEVNTATNEYSIKIDDVKKEDGGVYQCQITTSVPVTRSVTVVVQTRPVIIDILGSEQISEGMTVNMSCNATGIPEPTIYWKRMNNIPMPMGDVKYEGQFITIVNATKEDRGVYTCVAENGIEEPDSRDIPLLITFSPFIVTPRAKYSSETGATAELECVIEGYPDPVITWYNHMDEEVTDFGAFRTKNVVGSDDRKTSTLQVNNVKTEHFGAYRCHAANDLGEADGYVELSHGISAASSVTMAMTSLMLLLLGSLSMMS
ncbi:PREDICTED: lachesin-like [Priapulus caudatus]|uniref:Lachesin-like n=1 Tax=Priapulus caudatus TaxID=37621 RepID=A0ABM1DXL3_PRICU|nr:PREDICTED: lachesin-like [Priapulus caudatus]